MHYFIYLRKHYDANPHTFVLRYTDNNIAWMITMKTYHFVWYRTIYYCLICHVVVNWSHSDCFFPICGYMFVWTLLFTSLQLQTKLCTIVNLAQGTLVYVHFQTSIHMGSGGLLPFLFQHACMYVCVCMCMYVCVYVCVCVCMCVCVCVCMYACKYLAPAYHKDWLIIKPNSGFCLDDKMLLLVPISNLMSHGDRAFSRAAPHLWNSLSSNCRWILVPTQNIFVLKVLFEK